MAPASLVNDDWNRAIERLGGAEALASGARITRAFAWGRKVPDAVTLLRLVLAYCLGKWGLRSAAAWGCGGRLRRHLQPGSALSAAPVR
jgi:hypothetical protein